MASEVDICNLALTKLGEEPIISLTADSKAGRLCNLHYALARDDTLRSHPWNFAVGRESLALSTTSPAYDFSNQFALPTDFLRVISTDLPRGAVWKVEGKFILTDSATLKIRYVKRITDTEQFDALFVQALAARIAWELAIPLTDTRTLQEQMFNLFNAKISEARTVDAGEGTPDQIEASTWLDSRHVYRGSTWSPDQV